MVLLGVFWLRSLNSIVIGWTEAPKDFGVYGERHSPSDFMGGEGYCICGWHYYHISTTFFISFTTEAQFSSECLARSSS